MALAYNYGERFNSKADKYFILADEFARTRSRKDELKRAILMRINLSMSQGERFSAEKFLDEYEALTGSPAWSKRIELLQDRAYDVSLAEGGELLPEAEEIADVIEDKLDGKSEANIDTWSIAKLFGTIYLLGNQERATKLADRFHNLPGGKSIFQTSAHDMMGTGNYEVANAYYEAALARSPSGYHVRWNLAHRGRMASFGHRHEDAADYLQQAIDAVGVSGSTDDDWSRLGLIMNRALVLQDARSESAKGEFNRFYQKAKERDELYGIISAPWILHAGVMAGAAESELAELEAKSRDLLKTVEPRTSIGCFTVSLCCESLGELELRRKNPRQALEFFKRAVWIRRPAHFFHPKEWIADRILEILLQEGRTEELEEFLKQLIVHADKYYHVNHPERAFTRLRMVEWLSENDGSSEKVSPLLAEAKRIFDFQDEWISAEEHERLDKLLGKLSSN